VGRRSVLTLVAAALVTATLLSPAGSATKRAPAIKLKAAGFGNILATRGRMALYYWSVEKRDLKVRCTGNCAKVWPPLLAGSRAAVPKRVTGIRGAFGVIRRPDGRLQVTYNRLPLYTYAHERPNQVLCDNVNGWFVVRL
jgi:predicted lipoprotein with Yx(FWY)xxD motif